MLNDLTNVLRSQNKLLLILAIFVILNSLAILLLWWDLRRDSPVCDCVRDKSNFKKLGHIKDPERYVGTVRG